MSCSAPGPPREAARDEAGVRGDRTLGRAVPSYPDERPLSPSFGRLRVSSTAGYAVTERTQPEVSRTSGSKPPSIIERMYFVSRATLSGLVRSQVVRSRSLPVTGS